MKHILFDFTDYKPFLRELLHSKESERGLQSRLARHLGCQASYLYQVLKGKAELTEDQSYKVTTFLKFTEMERHFFMMLVRVSKAASIELKKYLELELERLKEENLNLKNKSDSVSAVDSDKIWDYYFSGSLPAFIHIMTSSEKFQTVEPIAHKLKVSTELISMHLEKLSEYGFVLKKNKKWHYSSPSIHLPKTSKHNLILQLMRRSQAISSIMSLTDTATHFSSLFTLDKTSYQKLRQECSEFVQRSQKLIHSGGTNDVYALCIDLFDPL